MTRGQDVLDTPEIRRHTERLLALKEKERQAQANLAFVIADIGDELIATKKALDKTSDKTAWLRWLSDNVNFARHTASNYMSVARLRGKWASAFPKFARLGPTALYLIASLPDDALAKLAQDPRLPSPKTGALTPLDQLSSRDLQKALEILLGRRKAPRLPQGSRNALARAVLEDGRALLGEIESVNAGSGKLDPANKREMLDFIEELRGATLHWKAWVTPQKGRRAL
ncbi:MAG: hypothetical protein HY077_18930 [Elusimicrobia bacterium]|nr:hypothetical protein [Elusimicrobiota bacterium]